MNLLFLDCETTGLKEPHLVQLAYMHSDGLSCSKLFKPPIPIEKGASEITGIYDDNVKDCEPFLGSDEFKFLEDHLPDSIFIAHNARFDMKVLDIYGLATVKHLCTLKVARTQIPTETSYKLTDLFSTLSLRAPNSDEVKAHDAMGDIIMMKQLLRYLTIDYVSKHDDSSVEDAIEYFVDISMNPMLKKMPFGKHKGVHMEQLPSDYVDWLRQQPDMDKDVLHTLSILTKNARNNT